MQYKSLFVLQCNIAYSNKNTCTSLLTIIATIFLLNQLGTISFCSKETTTTLVKAKSIQIICRMKVSPSFHFKGSPSDIANNIKQI